MSTPSTSIPKADILIIDDTPENLNLLSALLTEQGYKVRSVTKGSSGLRGAQAVPPDLILLDVNMPQMDGYEVCQHLKADERTCKIPVIFISALDDVLDKVKAFAVGGVDYITKPFQVEEVLARIENHLTIKRLSGQLQQQNIQLLLEIEERKRVEEALRQSETREREKAQALELTLDELKRTQAKLIQAEKLSSLGRMVAGVAHEINNSINFIHGNLTYASQYCQDLLELVQLYRKAYPNPIPDIGQLMSKIDLDFLVEDWSKVFNSMHGGTQRIQEIVLSLKNFSRLDEAELKPVDIHEGIDNSVLILQHRLKAEGNKGEIQVVKDYGQLPKVNCYASELNQVFMNLLDNAIDALKTQPEPKVITIRTEVVSRPSSIVSDKEHSTTNNEQLITDFGVIRIIDNGCGISEKVLPKIFDPFFTTKPVGSNRGLGLFTSHQIVVEKHGGQLNCISAPGQGTEFIVEIPL
ncbi:MAG TPA: hybrid sensor histidine kinase/response regulator [Cyanobacteria bacterium UBA8803]|nr:hybrid sensor histidine kinase/response regulator [Cyanobacteria bacterium UBA9273]HBL60141.1 hybrid sensor histidine kinase/response regulator [Cyanobacteria bacterium UBA8803]